MFQFLTFDWRKSWDSSLGLYGLELLHVYLIVFACILPITLIGIISGSKWLDGLSLIFFSLAVKSIANRIDFSENCFLIASNSEVNRVCATCHWVSPAMSARSFENSWAACSCNDFNSLGEFSPATAHRSCWKAVINRGPLGKPSGFCCQVTIWT